MTRAEAHARVRGGLLQASAAAGRVGIPGTAAEGQLIRPLVAWAGLGGAEPPPGFWDGVLAVQLAHEASLLHDDIIDGAAVRRGLPTLASLSGVAGALVRGDHLLTAAYRAAAGTGSLDFASLFARAVERTVAGESAQGAASGERLDRSRYEEIALGKAGELMGCALATAAVLRGERDAGAVFELGRRLGLLYQRVDDFLDYCPEADTGKPAMGDYAQGRWTWVLEEAPEVGFGRPAEEARAALHGGGASARALDRLKAEGGALEACLRERFPGDVLLGGLIGEWLERARAGLRAEQARLPRANRTAVASLLRARVPPLDRVGAYVAEHSRSFHFSLRFFARADAERVGRLYAFCRVTDDLVDRPAEGAPAERLLDEWLRLSELAYQGRPVGIALLDRVMEEAAAAGVPFSCAAELVEGMRMDLRGERYETLADLRRYTRRVAGVVGIWVARLAGVHGWALERAERLGHAMQLTNILRDVGEDWDRGRLYLPAEMLARHGVATADLLRMREGGPAPAGYVALVEEMMALAEADYRAAGEAFPVLPPSYARAVAVSAAVYRGIHREIRRIGYENLRRRAYTSPGVRVALAAAALWGLGRGSAAPIGAPIPATTTPAR